MPTIVAMLLALPLAGPIDRLADLPAEAEVTVAVLDVFDEPDEAATVPLRLRRGDRVNVRDADRAGWLTIDPPPGSFCWIEQSALGASDSKGNARVRAGRVVVRSGNPEARMPGMPRATLPAGTLVRLLDRPPLTLGEGRNHRTWRAIAPPPGDVRHIRAVGLRWLAPPRVDGLPEPTPAPAPAAEVRAVYNPPGNETPMAPEVAAELDQIESAHRAVLRGPMAEWRLDAVRQRYETLLRGMTDSAAGHAIRARLDEVSRDEAMARDARLIETLLERSRRRDATLALFERRLADAESPQARPYDVQGLIQPSSRQVDGQKVYALIGGDGLTEAYLDIPPGIDVKSLLTRRVGVRGTVHYNAGLRARLISVRDLEPLDKRR